MPGESKGFQALNRGKRSLVVDLQSPDGQQLVHRLIPRIDVVTINHRLGVAERLNIDYETLRAIRPDLIYWQNTGFGTAGPTASALDRTSWPRPSPGSWLPTRRSTTTALPT